MDYHFHEHKQAFYIFNKKINNVTIHSFLLNLFQFACLLFKSIKKITRLIVKISPIAINDKKLN